MARSTSAGETASVTDLNAAPSESDMLSTELGWLICFRLLSCFAKLNSPSVFFFTPLLSTLVSFDFGSERADFALKSCEEPSTVLLFDCGLFSRLRFELETFDCCVTSTCSFGKDFRFEDGEAP